MSDSPSSSDTPRPGAPRCHHYFLAHYTLRQVALAQPLFYLGILSSPDAQQFLASLVAHVDEHCQGSSPDLGVADLRIHLDRIGPYPCAVIEFPPPRVATEAYFTALVGLIDLSHLPEHEVQVPARYFTLEYSEPLAGPPTTVFGEWDTGGHHNYGGGTPPVYEAFVQRIADLLDPG